MTLFDYAQSIQERDKGMATAVSGRSKALETARRLARIICQLHGKVTADDVRREFEYRGGDWTELGNAAGSLFKGKQWQSVGFENSTVATSHARMIRVWKLI